MIVHGRSRAISAMTAILLVAVSLTLQACWWRRGRAAAEAQQQASLADITLQVNNHNYLDVVVYVLHDGLRTRIGTVTGSSAEMFTLPPRLLGQGHEIQLYGDPIGSEDFAMTERLQVQAGQFIEWTLESDLRRSSVGVY
jgi:hypothetical protein